VHDWKSCGRVKLPRGFESLPLRPGIASPGGVIEMLAYGVRVAPLFLARRAPRTGEGGVSSLPARRETSATVADVFCVPAGDDDPIIEPREEERP
jgi:hypothetical protein